MKDRFKKLRHFLFGPDLSPLKAGKLKHILLVAFYAWIGLGADGLSSSCYGPQEAFLALGQYTQLGLYLAIATALTVFIIALSYNQVIELFPTGGGGYKVATTLVHPVAGVISGSALIVDYILTITISVASGFDALFSLLPIHFLNFKVPTEFFFIIFLGFLNLRGAKESIKVLMPIFLGFVFTHAFMIIYGIALHANQLPTLWSGTVEFTTGLSQEMGWFFVIALFLRAYSIGGGTYTGIEAVSNNINILAEPRVTTGKWTMFYMAVSLSFTAAGIILLYLLWNVTPVDGQTLNAVAFKEMMAGWVFRGADLSGIALFIILFFEACLLFTAANTGFLGGPAVLANMASDRWMPEQFRHLSNRLVMQNGVLFMGIASILILLITHGRVDMLVILYSINVFITFTLSLLGLTIYWWKNRWIVNKSNKDHIKDENLKQYHIHHSPFDEYQINQKKWLSRLILSSFGFLVCASILIVILAEKFMAGGWITVLITGILIAICFFIKHHYLTVENHIKKIFKEFGHPSYIPSKLPPELDPKKPTAVIVIDENVGLGMHTLKGVQELFPNVYKNFVFIYASEIDADVLRREDKEKELLRNVTETLRYFVNYCHNHGLPATSYYSFGTDIIDTTVELAEKKIRPEYPKCVFFAGEILFENETWFTSWLYKHTPDLIQEALHFHGFQMVLLPMTLSI